jgi:alpha-glucuronidase
MLPPIAAPENNHRRHPVQRFLPTFVAMLLGSLLLGALPAASAHAAGEDGYELWLRYRPLPAALRARLQSSAASIVTLGAGSVTLLAARRTAARPERPGRPHAAACRRAAQRQRGTRACCRPASRRAVQARLRGLGPEGYLVQRTRLRGVDVTLIAANTDIGLLYGSFAWLRALQAGGEGAAAAIAAPALASKPALPRRLLNHWDNLDRSVERGYAGESIWNWWELPGMIDPRYTDYARANASLGINGTVLNNVNAKADVLGAPVHRQGRSRGRCAAPLRYPRLPVGTLVDPKELHETRSADPLDPAVAAWWQRKADEIYAAIPDFGGFLVKANSEGQPGPQDYGRTHADGANMLARSLAPHGGIVMWRAFVYSPPGKPGQASDRAAQAYEQFQPLDGKFDSNVIVQVKNGPIDFQPREPVHPLFGAMPETPLMMEFQLTKEYLGFATHLAYLGPLFEEALRFDTRAGGRAATVAQVLEGGPAGRVGGIAGVANIGSSRNWTGSDFDQANWYAFGRLAWDPRLSSSALAREWAAQTWSPDPRVLKRWPR